MLSAEFVRLPGRCRAVASLLGPASRSAALGVRLVVTIVSATCALASTFQHTQSRRAKGFRQNPFSFPVIGFMLTFHQLVGQFEECSPDGIYDLIAFYLPHADICSRFFVFRLMEVSKSLYKP
eukprot:208124-Pelagomonas_calceolata.AAC.1